MHCSKPKYPWVSFEYIEPPGYVNWPWRLPTVDAYLVADVLLGQRNIRIELGVFALDREVVESTEGEGVCPTGMSPCPENCRSIHVWGLYQNSRLDELYKWCADLGEVECMDLVKPEGRWDRAYAEITFVQSSSAQISLCCLHRMHLDGEVCCTGPGKIALQIHPVHCCPSKFPSMCLL
jgi:hypothetical protein